MLIKPEMQINEVLAFDEERMMSTLSWLCPDIGRLQSPHPMRAVVGSVTVEQAAKIAKIPLVEVLYALNLAAGEPEETISRDLRDLIVGRST